MFQERRKEKTVLNPSHNGAVPLPDGDSDVLGDPSHDGGDPLPDGDSDVLCRKCPPGSIGRHSYIQNKKTDS